MDKKQQKKSVSPAPKAVTKAKSPAKVSKEVASSPKTAKSAASPKAAATKASPAPATPAPLKYADIDVQQVRIFLEFLLGAILALWDLPEHRGGLLSCIPVQ
jgi:hypothetical protein